MDDQKARDLVALYRRAHPGLATFWQEIGQRVHFEMELEGICGHNPQRLLTDQRSEEEKFRGRFLSGIASMFDRPYKPWRSGELPWLLASPDSYEDGDFSLMRRRASTYRKD